MTLGINFSGEIQGASKALIIWLEPIFLSAPSFFRLTPSSIPLHSFGEYLSSWAIALRRTKIRMKKTRGLSLESQV